MNLGDEVFESPEVRIHNYLCICIDNNVYMCLQIHRCMYMYGCICLAYVYINSWQKGPAGQRGTGATASVRPPEHGAASAAGAPCSPAFIGGAAWDSRLAGVEVHMP